MVTKSPSSVANDADITAEKWSTVERRSVRVPKEEHKATREKMKHDHMNELFLELGRAIDRRNQLHSALPHKEHLNCEWSLPGADHLCAEKRYGHCQGVQPCRLQYHPPLVIIYVSLIRRHGVHEPRNPWSDGTEYITQCPIQPGGNFTQRINLTEEEGTLWWHAHSDWDRATLHGAIVIHPARRTTFPFPNPYKEIPILLGEWWIANVSQILADIIQTGGDPNISDAYTINGQPGDFYPCSQKDTFKVLVEHGKTHLLRVINAATNNELFFAVAGHKLIVVGTDASYTKPFTTDFIMITPGQTFDVLLEANNPAGANPSAPCCFYMAAHSYSSANNVSFDNTTATTILEYTTRSNPSASAAPPQLLYLPWYNDTNAAALFTAGLRSLASWEHPVDVPQAIDKRIIITVSVNLPTCSSATCTGPGNNRVAASLNNDSFQNPSIDILEAYYHSIAGDYRTDFPDRPPFYFNFTANTFPQSLAFTKRNTDVKVLEYNTTVEVVFQGTNLLAGENHPMHLHGFSFYVVGRGFGNYDEKRDPLRYNLVDPVYENAVGVPRNGWAAIRFRAANPGVWFMHCHLERHLTWGMDTVFIVKNGKEGPHERLLLPPPDVPPC